MPRCRSRKRILLTTILHLLLGELERCGPISLMGDARQLVSASGGTFTTASMPPTGDADKRVSSAAGLLIIPRTASQNTRIHPSLPYAYTVVGPMQSSRPGSIKKGNRVTPR
jgi:hypothetical protein